MEYFIFSVVILTYLSQFMMISIDYLEDKNPVFRGIENARSRRGTGIGMVGIPPRGYDLRLRGFRLKQQEKVNWKQQGF